MASPDDYEEMGNKNWMTLILFGRDFQKLGQEGTVSGWGE